MKLEEKIRFERSALARVRLTLTNEHVITSLNHASEYVTKVKNKKERERERPTAAVCQNIRRAYVIVPINKLEGPTGFLDDDHSSP